MGGCTLKQFKIMAGILCFLLLLGAGRKPPRGAAPQTAEEEIAGEYEEDVEEFVVEMEIIFEGEEGYAQAAEEQDLPEDREEEWEAEQPERPGLRDKQQGYPEEDTDFREQYDEGLPGVPVNEEDYTAGQPVYEQDVIIHRVWIWQETGDCLWNIAKEYYGDPWKWKLIYLANQDQIADPSKLFPKQELIIPPEE